MGAETTDMGTVTRRSLAEIVEKLREDAHQMASPFYTKTPDEPGWDHMAKAFRQIADEIEAATGGPASAACTEVLTAGDGSYDCNEPTVRGDKCERHKVERRERHWTSGDRRRPRSSDTPPSCGNGACRSELDSGGKTETRHDLRCPDRGPGWC